MATDHNNEFSRPDEVKISTKPLSYVQEDNGDGKIAIRLQLTQLSPDPAQYKPYSPQFKAPEDQPLQVQVEILKRYVKEIQDDGTIVLSPMGLARIAKIIATAIAKVHESNE